VLLDFPSPRVRAYPIETVVAEKFQAMVALGERNSRMKDFFDLLYLSNTFEFDGEILCKAIRRTFERRKTPLPVTIPIGLTDTFADSNEAMWNAFLRRSEQTDSVNFTEAIETLRVFFAPILKGFAAGAFSKHWKTGRWHVAIGA